MWESRIATTWEASREVQISRRCATWPTCSRSPGRAWEVALVSSDLRGLHLSAVDDLHRHGLHVVGLTVSDSESEERWLRSVGVDAVVPVRAGLAELEAHLLARTPGGAGRGGPPGLGVGSRAGHGAGADGGPADPPGPTRRRRTHPQPDPRPAPTSRPDPRSPGGRWADRRHLGPTGAPGRTTVAVNLASEIAAAKTSTLLVDLDTYGGSVAQVLGPRQAPGVAAACRAAEQGSLDVTGLARLSPQIAPHLRVLTGMQGGAGGPSCGPGRWSRCSSWPGHGRGRRRRLRVLPRNDGELAMTPSRRGWCSDLTACHGRRGSSRSARQTLSACSGWSAGSRSSTR